MCSPLSDRTHPDELCSSGMFFRARLHLLLSNGEAAEG